MRWWSWTLIGLGVTSTLLLVAVLSVRRSRDALIELVRLVPACVALLRDIMRDPTVPRRAKIAPALVLIYLAIPIDLIPDFIPGLGYLDDALIVAWAVRHLIAGAGRERVADHWKGDPAALERVLRLARVPTTDPPAASS
jgi:uncharacterized membrane protein YkvA (DUF1232 family)